MNYCSTDTTPCPPTSHTHQHPSSAKFAWGWWPLRTQMLPYHWGQVTFVVVQSLGHVHLFGTLWTAAHQPSLSFTISLNLLKLMSIESVMPFGHLILCCPLPLLPPNPSQHQGLFQWVTCSHEVAKVLEFQPQHQSFQWTLGLVSFRMDWMDLLAVQGTHKSLLQHHSSKASILQHSAFFTVQL